MIVQRRGLLYAHRDGSVWPVFFQTRRFNDAVTRPRPSCCRTISLSLISHSSKESCSPYPRAGAFSVLRVISLGETRVSEVSGSTDEFSKAGRNSQEAIRPELSFGCGLGTCPQEELAWVSVPGGHLPTTKFSVSNELVVQDIHDYSGIQISKCR